MFIVFRFRAVSFLVVSVDCNSVCNLDPSGVRTILEDSRGCALGRHIHMTDRVKTTPNVVNSIFLALHDAKHFIPCIMTICHNSLVPRPSSITAYRTVVWADDVAIEYEIEIEIEIYSNKTHAKFEWAGVELDHG